MIQKNQRLLAKLYSSPLSNESDLFPPFPYVLTFIDIYGPIKIHFVFVWCMCIDILTQMGLYLLSNLLFFLHVLNIFPSHY